ncbi:MAG: hypothetical protein AAF721_09365 [Myxococcota bacterium]
MTRACTLAAVALALSCTDEAPDRDPYGSGISLDGGIDDDGGDDDGADDGDGDGGGDDGEKFDVGADGGMAEGGGDDGACPCQNVMDGIYVLNSNSPPSVWFFDPPANTFTEVGTLGCNPGVGWTANSMAIDREGYAWVNYYDQPSAQGKIFRAPLSDLGQCQETGYQNPAGAWWLLGMGYAVVDEASSCDELFIYRSDRYLEYPNFAPGGADLARFDQASDSLSIVGATDYPVGELTGTGDSRLFAFAPVDATQAVLVALDKSTGAELEHSALPGLDITNAFAFAFWGGDVYFFTETAPQSGVSKVTKLDYDGNEGGGLSEYNANTGIHIPGAGVSTCASFEPPA